MKYWKKNLLTLCNRMLSGVLVLLGFTACDNNGMGGEEPVMYGQPYANYEIKGKVQDKESKQPVVNTRIIVKELDLQNRPWRPYADCNFFRYCEGNGMHLRDAQGELLHCHLKRWPVQ